MTDDGSAWYGALLVAVTWATTHLSLQSFQTIPLALRRNWATTRAPLQTKGTRDGALVLVVGGAALASGAAPDHPCLPSGLTSDWDKGLLGCWRCGRCQVRWSTPGAGRLDRCPALV